MDVYIEFEHTFTHFQSEERRTLGKAPIRLFEFRFNEH